MTDIEFVLTVHNINYPNISADEVKFIKEKLIPKYDFSSDPFFNEYPDVFKQVYCVDGEKRIFSFKDLFNMFKSVVDSFEA